VQCSQLCGVWLGFIPSSLSPTSTRPSGATRARTSVTDHNHDGQRKHRRLSQQGNFLRVEVGAGVIEVNFNWRLDASGNPGEGGRELGDVVLRAHGFAGAEGLGEAAVGAAAGGSGVGTARSRQNDHQPETRPALDLGRNPLDVFRHSGHLALGCGTRKGPSASASMDDFRKVSRAWSGVVTIGSPTLNEVLSTIGSEVFFSNSVISSA